LLPGQPLPGQHRGQPLHRPGVRAELAAGGPGGGRRLGRQHRLRPDHRRAAGPRPGAAAAAGRAHRPDLPGQPGLGPQPGPGPADALAVRGRPGPVQPAGRHPRLGGLRPPGGRRAQLRGGRGLPGPRRGRPARRRLHRRHRPAGPARVPVPAPPSAWEQAAKGWATRAGWPRYTMVPMEADGQVVGFAAAFGPRVDADFTGADTETLLPRANQGAAALVNEELYRAAENERAQLRDIVGHSSDGIYTVGPDRTVRSWNAAMVALTGYQEDEAVGQKCFNLLRARDGDGVDMCAADCPILAAAASGHEEVREASVLNKEGLARWIRYAHAPIIGSSEEMDTDGVVVRDVTRERQTDELKNDFVASVSHELRTPLTPIKGFLMTLLREDRDFAQDRRREYYRLMLMQSQRLERLIEDLLEVTRLEAGAGLVDATAIDAVDLVRQVVDRFTSEDPDRTVQVVAPDHAVFCRGDWMRIDQVLGNLLANALPYAPPHEPVGGPLGPQGREVGVEVRDWGPGIPIDEQSRIFERFHRVGHYMTREPGGAGLGLYLAKRLVEAMGGRIWVSSRLGPGSVLSFALPAAPRPHAVFPRDRSTG